MACSHFFSYTYLQYMPGVVVHHLSSATIVNPIYLLTSATLQNQKWRVPVVTITVTRCPLTWWMAVLTHRVPNWVVTNPQAVHAMLPCKQVLTFHAVLLSVATLLSATMQTSQFYQPCPQSHQQHLRMPPWQQGLRKVVIKHPPRPPVLQEASQFSL